MSQEQEEEIRSLLWSYKDITIKPEQEYEKVQAIKDYLKMHRIPLSTLGKIFKGRDDDAHYNAINAVSKIAYGSISGIRFGQN